MVNFVKHYLNKVMRFLKSAEVLEDEKLLRLKTHILTVFNDYVVNHLQIENQFYLTQSWTINHKGDAHHSHIHPNTILVACIMCKQIVVTYKLSFL